MEIEQEVFDCLSGFVIPVGGNIEMYQTHNGFNLLLASFIKEKDSTLLNNFLDKNKIPHKTRLEIISGRYWSYIDFTEFKKLTEAVKKMMEQDKFEEIKALVKELFCLEFLYSENNDFSFYGCEKDDMYDFCIKNNIPCSKFESERYCLGHRIKGDPYVLQVFSSFGYISDGLLAALREEKKRRDIKESPVNINWVKSSAYYDTLSEYDYLIEKFPESVKKHFDWLDKNVFFSDEETNQSPPRFSKQTRQELKAYRQKLNKVKARIEKKIGHVDALIGGE